MFNLCIFFPPRPVFKFGLHAKWKGLEELSSFDHMHIYTYKTSIKFVTSSCRENVVITEEITYWEGKVVQYLPEIRTIFILALSHCSLITSIIHKNYILKARNECWVIFSWVAQLIDSCHHARLLVWSNYIKELADPYPRMNLSKKGFWVKLRCTVTCRYPPNSDQLGLSCINIPEGTSSRILSWEKRSFDVTFVWFQGEPNT